MLDSPGFLDRLASSDPVPGGGSVAALEAAMAASLLAMVSNLTIGRPKYADVQEQAEVIRAEAMRLRDRANKLADEDVEAYGAVSSALALPRSTDNERTVRRQQMQAALKGASMPPLATMEVARDLLVLSARLVRIGNRSAISDVGTAALAARAAFHAARLNVEINLAAVRDPEWAGVMRRRLVAFDSIDDSAQSTLDMTEKSIRGESD